MDQWEKFNEATLPEKEEFCSNLNVEDKYVALSNLSIYYTWKNIKKPYKIKRFKISALTWNEEFELTDGSYSVSNIQDYLKCI